MITGALAGKPLPVYSDGMQVRDRLYVKDHGSAIHRVLADDRPGETHNVGGWNKKSNIEVVHMPCAILDELSPRADCTPYATQISFVTNNLGHDRRYAINSHKFRTGIGVATSRNRQDRHP